MKVPRELAHVEVYRRPGRFAAWPANHGIWSWGDEILVGFSAGRFREMGPGDQHAIDPEAPEDHLLARSLDGGRSWSIENPAEAGVLVPQGPALHGRPPPGVSEPAPVACPHPLDFAHPDLALAVRMWSVHTGPSRLYASTDRGRTWEGPYRLPLFGWAGIAGRTDYLIDGPRGCRLFLTAAKADGREGRPMCARTRDGGRTWEAAAWIGPEPPADGFAIQPSTARLAEREIVTAVRCLRRRPWRAWIDLYASDDDGGTWRLRATPVADTGGGSPPSLVRLLDGRLCLVYGYRAPPYEIRARLSEDGGRSWGEPLVLATGGGDEDIGYPCTVQRPDGTLVSVYYFNDAPDAERYVAAALWRPDLA